MGPEGFDVTVAGLDLGPGELTYLMTAVAPPMRGWRRARAGHESQMRKLDALLAVRGKGACPGLTPAAHP